MTVCFREGATSLGYASLKPEQKLSSEFFEGEDVFVSFPAGLHSVHSTGTYTGILMSPDLPVLCAKVWPWSQTTVATGPNRKSSQINYTKVHD